MPPRHDPALVERFSLDWHGLTGACCAERAIVALSGGPDSSALLMLMAVLRPAIGPVLAATVDHKLRAASSAEAGRAADLAESLGVEHRILEGPLAERVGSTANLSARARELRYGLLQDFAAEVGASWIVTAHHADDQLETMVMRLNRGAGVRGLAGVRARSERIVRPLLGWRRDELAGIVAAAGITAIDDPSNRDDRFDRARLRKLLADAPWLDPAAAARSAAALADADDAVDWAVDIAEERCCRYDDGQAILTAAFLPAEVRRRLVERCLGRIDPASDPRGADVTRLIVRLHGGLASTLGRVAIHIATAPGAHTPMWVFRPAPPHAG